MNRNRHISEKADQKRVRSGHRVNKDFKVVTYPTHKKHIQPHLPHDYATTKKERYLQLVHSKKAM